MTYSHPIAEITVEAQQKISRWDIFLHSLPNVYQTSGYSDVDNNVPPSGKANDSENSKYVQQKISKPLRKRKPTMAIQSSPLS